LVFDLFIACFLGAPAASPPPGTGFYQWLRVFSLIFLFTLCCLPSCCYASRLSTSAPVYNEAFGCAFLVPSFIHPLHFPVPCIPRSPPFGATSVFPASALEVPIDPCVTSPTPLSLEADPCSLCPSFSPLVCLPSGCGPFDLFPLSFSCFYLLFFCWFAGPFLFEPVVPGVHLTSSGFWRSPLVGLFLVFFPIVLSLPFFDLHLYGCCSGVCPIFSYIAQLYDSVVVIPRWRRRIPLLNVVVLFPTIALSLTQ